MTTRLNLSIAYEYAEAAKRGDTAAMASAADALWPQVNSADLLDVLLYSMLRAGGMPQPWLF